MTNATFFLQAKPIGHVDIQVLTREKAFATTFLSSTRCAITSWQAVKTRKRAQAKPVKRAADPMIKRTNLKRSKRLSA